MSESLYLLPILLFSVVVHEIAHGWTALKCGDPTAKMLGRLTLNPIPHLDLFGSILLPALIIISNSPFFIAWAKPVPVNPANFRNLRKDDILVSLAGPVSNLLMALVCTIIVIILHIFIREESQFLSFLKDMFIGGISLNVVLAIFNLIPIPPLDGSHIIASLLPENIGEKFRNVGFFGIFLILFILQVPFFKQIFYEIINVFLMPYRFIIELFL